MKNKTLEQLKTSLGGYAIGDLKNNIDKPIAAFILGGCLIRALSYIRNGVDSKEGFALFCEQYLPMYDGNGLYESIIERLLPFYSLNGGMYKIGWGKKTGNELGNEIHVSDFVSNIEAAYNMLITDIEDSYEDVVAASQSKHPIISDKSDK